MQEQPHSKQRENALGRGDGRCRGPGAGSTGRNLEQARVVCGVVRWGGTLEATVESLSSIFLIK